MNPHDLLRLDHQALRTEAGRLRAAIEIDSQKLLEALLAFQKAIYQHFKREDVYYRVLDDGKRMKDRAFTHQLRNDHAAVIFALESLVIRLRKNGITPEWRIRFDTLMGVFLPHLDQEETLLFPQGMKMLSAQELESIARDIEACE